MVAAKHIVRLGVTSEFIHETEKILRSLMGHDVFGAEFRDTDGLKAAFASGDLRASHLSTGGMAISYKGKPFVLLSAPYIEEGRGQIGYSIIKTWQATLHTETELA